MSEKIKPTHVERLAILYVRQSSAYQVTHNLESRRLQYAMQSRLGVLGWQTIEVIDEDLGKSAGGSVARAGFQRLVADVCLGKVGVVAARELSRFARNSRDWQQLVEVCRIVDTLLVDEEAIYDARDSNDRLLLGLKGSLSEYELDLLRQRSQAARKQKALRAEMGMTCPVGYVNVGNGALEKTADARVQQAIRTVFEQFLELGTARQVLMWLLDRGLQLPSVRWERGQWVTVWRASSYHPIVRLLKHPIYAGAYAWGKTCVDTVLDQGQVRRVSQRKPRDAWLVLLRDHHEAYIDWATHERIGEMIRKNAQVCAPIEPGAAKRGAAMLAGVLRCRRCGRKLRVRYTGGGAGHVLRYVCHSGFEGSGEAKCISFSGAPVDEAVVHEVLKVIQPGALEAAALVHQQTVARTNQHLTALELDLEARQYEVDRARRQYDAVDPSNRLVAAELERRWNAALEHAEAARQRLEDGRTRDRAIPAPSAETLAQLAADLRAVWDHPATDIRLKKRILRTLVEEVIADVEAQPSAIHLVVHWAGGVHTELRLKRRRPGQARHNTPPDLVEAVRSLARLCSDERIAGWLTRNGLRTGKGLCWTRQHVTGLRHRNDIAVYQPRPPGTASCLTLSQAAERLGVDRMTLRAAIRRGDLAAERPLPIGPWILKREDVESDAARVLAARVSAFRRNAGRRAPDARTLSLFNGS